MSLLIAAVASGWVSPRPCLYDAVVAHNRQVSSEILIRPLTARDREVWSPLWDGYNEFYGRVGPTALDPAVTEQTWARLMDATEPVWGLVAEINGRVVGFVHYLFHHATTLLAENCLLHDLFTTPEARGHGVGRALIEAVFEAAARAGSTRVYWTTHESNETAQRLYDTLAERGFIVYRHEL